MNDKEEKQLLEAYIIDLNKLCEFPNKWWLKLDIRDKWKKRLKEFE